VTREDFIKFKPLASVKPKTEIINLLNNNSPVLRLIFFIRRRGALIIYLFFIPNLELGHANKEIKAVNERIKLREK
jgi:hypothetical protein